MKLKVDLFTLEEAWDPRRKGSKIPQWYELKDGEYLLGSYSDGLAYTVLPFRVVNQPVNVAYVYEAGRKGDRIEGSNSSPLYSLRSHGSSCRSACLPESPL